MADWLCASVEKSNYEFDGLVIVSYHGVDLTLVLGDAAYQTC